MTHTPTDSLRFIDARGHDLLDYVMDQLGQLGAWPEDFTPDRAEDLCTFLELVSKLIADERATHTDDRWHYDDGRLVKSRREIQDGLITTHTWHPNADAEQPRSWRSHLPSGDPDVPSPGLYEVDLDPSTQEITVRTVRFA